MEPRNVTTERVSSAKSRTIGYLETPGRRAIGKKALRNISYAFVLWGILLFSGLYADNAWAVWITVLGDTYVSSASPNTNFGPTETLNVSSQSTTLLAFPLTS